MENATSYLLSEQQKLNHYYLIRERQKELDAANEKHLLISKYHERLWFQRLWHASYEELLGEYYRLAKSIERLEQSIDQSKYLLHMHNCAVEFLHNHMKPFEAINISTTILHQQTLF